MFSFLLHITAELKIAFLYPVSESQSRVIPMYSLHTYFPSPVLSPGGEKKSRKRREVSEQITQFGNNKGIFCPGTHTL